MFRTSYDSKGKPQTYFDRGIRWKTGGVGACAGELSRAGSEIDRIRQKWSNSDEFRQAVICEIARVGQDQHADAEAYKAGLELLLKDRTATTEQVATAIEIARRNARADRQVLDSTVEIQKRLRPRYGL
jgi:hypothetical protein